MRTIDYMITIVPGPYGVGKKFEMSLEEMGKKESIEKVRHSLKTIERKFHDSVL